VFIATTWSGFHKLGIGVYRSSSCQAASTSRPTQFNFIGSPFGMNHLLSIQHLLPSGSNGLGNIIRFYSSARSLFTKLLCLYDLVLLLLAETYRYRATVEETRGSTPLSPFSIGPEYYQARWVPRNAFLEVKRIVNGSVNKAVIWHCYH